MLQETILPPTEQSVVQNRIYLHETDIPLQLCWRALMLFRPAPLDSAECFQDQYGDNVLPKELLHPLCTLVLTCFVLIFIDALERPCRQPHQCPSSRYRKGASLVFVLPVLEMHPGGDLMCLGHLANRLRPSQTTSPISDAPLRHSECFTHATGSIFHALWRAICFAIRE